MHGIGVVGRGGQGWMSCPEQVVPASKTTRGAICNGEHVDHLWWFGETTVYFGNFADSAFSATPQFFRSPISPPTTTLHLATKQGSDAIELNVRLLSKFQAMNQRITTCFRARVAAQYSSQS